MSCVDTDINNTNHVIGCPECHRIEPFNLVHPESAPCTNRWHKLYKGETIEQEARRLVEGERQKGYSHPAENFGRIAKIWSGIIGTDVTPEHVAMCMVGVKLARECHEHNRDNLVDAIGYVLTLDMVNGRRS